MASWPTCVRDLMRPRFIQLQLGDSLLEAERLMRMARVRRLPVVEAGALLGVLSHRLVLASSLADGPLTSARWMRETGVGALMDRRPLVVTPQTGLGVAVERLIECSEGCLPVVEGERGEPLPMLGILTERDLLRAAYESGSRL
jgi:CBS domain-containing protein